MSRHSTPLDDAVVTAAPYLAGGVVAALPLLAVPSSTDRVSVLLIHLAGLVAFGLVLTTRVFPLVGDDWFPGRPWSEAMRRTAGVVSLIVIVTGTVGLVTLASSAALRFQPSLQFLQLLSALDIAWVVAALMIGLRLRGAGTGAVVAGVLMAVACVGSIWNYLRVVGLAPDGGWFLDGEQLMRLVLPADTIAALVAVVVLIGGLRARRSG